MEEFLLELNLRVGVCFTPEKRSMMYTTISLYPHPQTRRQRKGWSCFEHRIEDHQAVVWGECTLALPKSQSFSWWVAVLTSRFWGLMSLWHTPFW